MESAARRTGFTLIEVLVVLVVLILGIFALARLFPEGFASLGATANRTQAGALARYMEDYERRFKENLPDGVMPMMPQASGLPLPRTNMTPEDFFSALPYPATAITGYSGPDPDDPRYSDINQVRHVVGETVKIAPPTVFPYNPSVTNEQVCLYHVLFAPIYSAALNSGHSGGVQVYSGSPLQRVEFEDPYTPEDTDRLRALGPFGYGIDYQNQTLYFNPVPFDRNFRLQYTIHTDTGVPLQSGVLFRTVPANTQPAPQAVSLNVPVPGAAVDPGSDILVREFRAVPAATPFSAEDPFEYKVYDAFSGLIGFNPNLYNPALIDPSSPNAPVTPHPVGRGVLAKIDYDVDDWHVLKQDDTVSGERIDPDGVAGNGNERYVLKLLTNNIRRVGDLEDPVINLLNTGEAGFEHQGLVRYYPGRPGTPGADSPDPLDGVDLLIVDQETGLIIDSRTLQKEGNHDSGEIDYARGIVHLRENPGFYRPYDLGGQTVGAPVAQLPIAGRHVRVYYRTAADSGAAMYKAFSHYYMAPSSPPTAREFLQGASGYLLFAAMEEEKTVAVDYSWRNTTTGVVRHETGELHQIKKAGSVGGPQSPPPATSWIRLGHGARNGATDYGGDPASDPNGIFIRAVRGASITNRIVWRDRNRPRHLQRSTVLTTGP